VKEVSTTFPVYNFEKATLTLRERETKALQLSINQRSQSFLLFLQVKITRNEGLISADRSNKATLLLTIPRSIFKSSTRDLNPIIFERLFGALLDLTALSLPSQYSTCFYGSRHYCLSFLA
jgi:hypothetical protein